MALLVLSGPKGSHEAEVSNLNAPSALHRRIEPIRKHHAIASAPNAEMASSLRGDQILRESVLLTFRDPLPEQCFLLWNLSGREWRGLLRWLHISGLALYFLDRMVELGHCDKLPPSVLTGLRQNLSDNIERTRGMITESIAIQREFQEGRLCYAKLKGLSLWPVAVPKPELRCQFDLDFLIAEQSAPEARRILERRGYSLYTSNGRSWEYKINNTPGFAMDDLYKDLPYRSVELHVESRGPGQPSLLDRREWRELYGIAMPVLSPVDLFLGHAIHAYKNVCSEFSRTAHLLEFRRHVLTRSDDSTFWKELQQRAQGNRRACLGLGVVTLLVTRVIGDFAPEALTDWTVRRLPPAARLWVEVYGHRRVVEKFPGSKLYLLLQRELESAGVPAKRSLRQSLLPSRLPPAVIRALPNETLSVRIGRYWTQLGFIFLRLRFHIVEGIRYAWESRAWRRRLSRLAT
jgi:hypothetical protein